MIILKNHVSPETAYVVMDYPYGFRLRCQIRYWLDVHAKRGVRFMAQTTNPKKPGLVWNKPKASTYALFGACMFLNSEGHVNYAGLTEYTNGAEAAAWRDKYGAGVPFAARVRTEYWVKAKLTYDARIAEGESMVSAAAAAAIETATIPIEV